MIWYVHRVYFLVLFMNRLQKIFSVTFGLLVCVSCSSTVPQEMTQKAAVQENTVTTTTAPIDKKVNITSDIKEDLVKKSAMLLPLLQKKDFSSLVPFVHPVKGLMIAAQARIEMGDDYPVRTISVTDLPRFLENTKKTIWGSRGATGMPIEMTAKDFWEKIMFRRKVTPSLKYTFDTVQATDMNDEGIKEQLQKRFPGSHFVDYLLPEVSSENVLEYERQASFRLIFEEYQGRWYLVGLMLDQFTI